MSLKDENDIANFITQQIKIEFPGKKFKLNTWGQVDKWIELTKDNYVFIEVETQQLHPHNNVIKVWPYLDENPAVRIFLIQTFYPYSRGISSNRGRLGSWIAQKMKETFPDRFEYVKLVIDGEKDKEELEQIQKRIKAFIKGGKD